MGKRGTKPRLREASRIDVLTARIRERLEIAFERKVERLIERMDELLDEPDFPPPARVPDPGKAAVVFRDTNVSHDAPPRALVASTAKVNAGRKCGRCRQPGHRSDNCPNEPASEDDGEPEPPRAPPVKRATREESFELITRAQAGDRAALDQLVRQNIAMVHWIARKHPWHSMPYEDIVQEGTIGLVKGIMHFDVTRGLALATYLPYWIRHEIGRSHLNDGLIRIPVASHEQLQKLSKLQRKAGRELSISELSERSGIQAKSVTRLLTRGTVTMPEKLPDVPVPHDDHAEMDDMLTEARAAVAALPERLRTVMELRYYGEEQRTLSQVGAVLGISRERARQLETQALKIIRARTESAASGTIAA